MQYTHGGDIYTYGEMIDFSVISTLSCPSKKVIEAAKRALLQSAAYPDCKCRKLREETGRQASGGREDVCIWKRGGRTALYSCPGRKIEESSPPHSSFSEYEQALKTVGCEIKYYQTKKIMVFV